jgi:AbiJ N-terminal domain 4
MEERFSRRPGVRPTPANLIRDDAPQKMRSAALAILIRHGVEIAEVLDTFYETLLQVRPDYLRKGNSMATWPNFEPFLKLSEWWEIYDFIEATCGKLKNAVLDESINDLFLQYGIGWKILHGRIEVRGDAVFEHSIENARGALRAAGRKTAASELEEALADLSRRPDADARGAIARSVGVVEAVAKDLLAEPNATLGQLIKKLELPKPLDTAAAQLWGYASDQARHVTEGYDPKLREASFVVRIASALIAYLSGDEE